MKTTVTITEEDIKNHPKRDELIAAAIGRALSCPMDVTIYKDFTSILAKKGGSGLPVRGITEEAKAALREKQIKPMSLSVTIPPALLPLHIQAEDWHYTLKEPNDEKRNAYITDEDGFIVAEIYMSEYEPDDLGQFIFEAVRYYSKAIKQGDVSRLEFSI